MQPIGFSTGCVYKLNLGIDKAVELYSSFGADAIELSFLSVIELLNFRLPREFVDNTEKYDYLSVHAPCKEIRYKKDYITYKCLGKLKELSYYLKVNNVVVHSDVVDDFSVFEDFNLPFSIENMDKRNKNGISLKEFEKLKEDYEFGFVLDLQHAYEHDNSMRLCYDLIEVMGKRLNEMHASGCNGNKNHNPVYSSENKDKITDILNLNLKVPRILEGVLSDNFKEEIQKELELVRSYEK